MKTALKFIGFMSMDIVFYLIGKEISDTFLSGWIFGALCVGLNYLYVKHIL